MGGIRFEHDGGVTMITGTLDYGQGHASPFAQVLVQPARHSVRASIRLLQGDSDELLFGGGTGGSRSTMASGTALLKASDQVIEQGKQIAAHVLEAAAADIEFGKGRFRIVGTDRSIGIMELATKLRDGLDLPEGVPHSLDVSLVDRDAALGLPNGCHVAEVELDPETGVIDVVQIFDGQRFRQYRESAHWSQGQAHGGVVQGIGQALMERTWSRRGRPVAEPARSPDYAELPRAEGA